MTFTLEQLEKMFSPNPCKSELCMAEFISLNKHIIELQKDGGKDKFKLHLKHRQISIMTDFLTRIGSGYIPSKDDALIILKQIEKLDGE